MEVLSLKEPIESNRQSGRVGRPSEFTPKRRRAILEAIKLGMPEGRAAELCGLDPSALAHWKARGREEEGSPYSDFLKDLQEADAHCEFALLAKVRKAAEEPKHWRAAMALLERKWPKRWGKLEREKAGGISFEEYLEASLNRQKAMDATFAHVKESDHGRKAFPRN